VGVDVADHHGRVLGGLDVHGLALELDPADPGVAPVGDDPERVALEQLPAVLPQPRELAAVVRLREAELRQEVLDLILDRIGVDRLLEQLVDASVLLESVAAERPVERVHRLRTVEETLDVVGSESHSANTNRFGFRCNPREGNPLACAYIPTLRTTAAARSRGMPSSCSPCSCWPGSP
jgi:hypothetical protein